VKLLARLAWAASLAACAVGPDYKAPPPPKDATAPLVSPDSPVATAAEAPDAWWRLYEDTRLDALVQEAFAANADLKVAQANLTGARAIYLAARSARLPSTNLALGVNYGRDAGTDEILELTGRRPVTLWIYDALIDVNYEVDLFGHVRHSIEAAGAGSEVSEAQRDAVRVTVAAETARAYAQICAVGEQLAVARRSLDLVSRESDITAPVPSSTWCGPKPSSSRCGRRSRRWKASAALPSTNWPPCWGGRRPILRPGSRPAIRCPG
jgi:outer membrane protein TolC